MGCALIALLRTLAPEREPRLYINEIFTVNFCDWLTVNTATNTVHARNEPLLLLHIYISVSINAWQHCDQSQSCWTLPDT